MPQAIVGVIAAAGIPGLVTATGALTLGGNLLAGAIGFGISYGANALFQEDAPKPAEMRGTVRQSVSSRRKSYGEGPMGAAIIFFEVRDGALVQILYLGEGGELGIDAFTEWRLDERIVTVEPDGNINTSPIDGKVEVEFRLGSASQLHYDRVAEIFPEIYDATHRCRGCITVMVKANKVKTEKITDVYPNRLPQLVPVARRNKVFDPRTGLTAYSANLPLIFRNYLVDLDGAGLPASMIDEDDFELAADIGDELLATSGGGTVRRYHGQLDYKLEEEPIDIIERMITATDGRLFLKRSGKIGYRAGKYVAPTVSIPDAVIVSYSLKDSSGPLREGTEVTVRYQNKLARHTEATCDPWIIDADGTRKPIPIQAYEIQEHHHARRVAKRRAQRATARWRGTIVTDLFGLEAWEEQYIYLEVRDLGIDFEPFEIMDIREGDDDMTVIIDVVSLPEDPETMHDLTFAEEGTPPTIPEDLDDESIHAPENLTVSIEKRNVGDATIALLVASWDAYPDRDDLSAQAQISLADAEEWTDITVADSNTRSEAVGIADGQRYDVRVRWKEPDGKPSDWALFENALVSIYEQESLALFAAMTTPPTTSRKGHINTLIRALKNAGVWAKLTKIAVLAAANEQTALLDWKNPGGIAFTKVGTIAFAANRGFTGDGATGYLDSGVAWNTLVSQDNASMWAWSLTETSANAPIVGTTTGSGSAFVGPKNGTAYTVRAHGAQVTVDNVGTSIGLFGWSRSLSSALRAYRNKVESVISQTSAAPPTGNMTVLRTAGTYGPWQVSFAAAGAALSTVEQAALYDAVAAYLTDVGAI